MVQMNEVLHLLAVPFPVSYCPQQQGVQTNEACWHHVCYTASVEGPVLISNTLHSVDWIIFLLQAGVPSPLLFFLRLYCPLTPLTTAFRPKMTQQ